MKLDALKSVVLSLLVVKIVASVTAFPLFLATIAVTAYEHLLDAIPHFGLFAFTLPQLLTVVSYRSLVSTSNAINSLFCPFAVISN